MLKFNNIVVKYDGKWLKCLPPNTLRLRYKDGVTPTFTKGTAVHISTSPNIWELTSIDWYDAFQGHTDLLEVVDSGDMSSVTDMCRTFKDCSSLISVCPMNVRLNKLSRMFQNCSSLVSAPFITITPMDGYCDYIFDGCTSLTSVPLLDTSSFTTANFMFRNCSSLTTVPAFNLRRASSTASMFEGCTSLTTVPTFTLPYTNQLNSMFKGCTSLTTMPSITLSRDLSRCISVFEDCINIESGILNMYNNLSSKTVIYYTIYSSCFKNCGINTTTGAAELAQIPSDWK